MLVDGVIGFDPSGVIETARLAEQCGYDALWTAEVNHDPFLPLLLAADHTERRAWARPSRSPSPATR